MRRHLDIAVRMTILTALVFGLLYPLAITGVAQVLFPDAAGGSLVTAGGRVVGSALIGQRFTQARYFHARPSAAGEGYDAMASSASNLGPTSQALIDRVATDVEAADASQPRAARGRRPRRHGHDVRQRPGPAHPVAERPRAGARVAAARGMSARDVLALIDEHTTGRTFGFLGEPRVNVLELNLALDGAAAAGEARAAGP